MPLQIVQVGEPVLRQRARPLSKAEILSSELQRLIQEMSETMREAPGVGLAAPQIGRDLQLAVVEDLEQYHKEIDHGQLATRERRPVPFTVLVNPEITWRSDDTKDFFEGCLSLAGFSAIVPRARSIRVNYLDDHATPCSVDATGWHARILQHEIDHLQGHLYLDRMRTRTFTSLDNLKNYWKDLPPAEVLARLG
jgi:peptide deformylase